MFESSHFQPGLDLLKVQTGLLSLSADQRQVGWAFLNSRRDNPNDVPVAVGNHRLTIKITFGGR